MQSLVAAGLALLPLAVVAEGSYDVTVGVEYSEGDYGGETATSLWYLPLTLRYTTAAYAWAVTVPYVVVSGPGDVVVTSGGMQRIGRGPGRTTGMPLSPNTTTATERTEVGVGDVQATFTRRLSEEGPQRPWMALTAKIKLATADEARGLGSGENDYALQLELAQGPFDTYAGYKILGDPAGVELQDVWFGAVALSWPLGGRTDARLQWYGEQAALAEDGAARSEATLSLARHLERRTWLVGHVLTGLADGSPDWGAGVSVRFLW